MLPTINTLEATQRVVVTKLIRLTLKIVIQLHLVAESGNFWIHPHIHSYHINIIC